MTLDIDLSIERFSLPLESPLETAHGTITSRDGFLVWATDGEVTGVGEATPLPGWTESFGVCADALERGVRICDRDGPVATLEAIHGSVAARHGVALAILDYQCIRRAKPLYERLKAPMRVARVPVNATIGDSSPEKTAEKAEEAVETGFRCCKLKAGVRPLEDDIERIRRTREAVGRDVELRVDANGAWTYEEAERALEAFGDLDVSLLEQPLPDGALGGHAELRGRGVDIALDEGLLEHGVDAIADAEAADVVVLKPMALGGVDIAREAAAWLAEVDVEPIVTTTIDGVVARTGAVHLAAALPDVRACGLATGELLATDLAPDPVRFEKGNAVVPQAKGLGVSVARDEYE